MTRRSASHVAWVLLYPAGVALLLVALPARFVDLTSPHAATDLARPTGGTYAVALFVLEILVLAWYVANTLFMAWRRWSDWVAVYVSVGGVTWVAFALPEFGTLAGAEPRLALPVAVMQWLGGAMPVLFLLFFPDGRFVPRNSAVLAVIWPATWALSVVAFPGTFGLLTMPAPRLAIWLTFITIALGAPLYRARFAGSVVRQQTKWIVVGNFIVFIGVLAVLPARFLPEADLPSWLRPWVTYPLFVASLVGLAFAFTMAMLKYRLWDIDVVIRRTLVYGALVAILGAVYVSLVLGLQALLGQITRGDTLAVALATLATAALFSPARQRVGEAVDRRFYRARYDAARTLDGFSHRVRDEVDLDDLRADLVASVRQTIAPTQATVWLRERTVADRR